MSLFFVFIGLLVYWFISSFISCTITHAFLAVCGQCNPTTLAYKLISASYKPQALLRFVVDPKPNVLMFNIYQIHIEELKKNYVLINVRSLFLNILDNSFHLIKCRKHIWRLWKTYVNLFKIRIAERYQNNWFVNTC